MAFFLNNNTTSMFRAAKQLTALSKDYTIFMKDLERASSLQEIADAYEKVIQICSEMEEVSEKAVLSAGIAAAEDRIEEVISTTVKILCRIIEKAENREEALKEVLSCEDVFAEEILEGVQEANK